MSGFEFCHTVHQFSDLPIIMLTAVNEEETVIEGLEKYAEDYMIKPFNPGELVARVRRVLKHLGGFAFHLDALTRIDERLVIDFPAQSVDPWQPCHPDTHGNEIVIHPHAPGGADGDHRIYFAPVVAAGTGL